VIFAQPDARHTNIAGLKEWRRYEWLPEPEGFSYTDDLLPGFGRAGVEVCDPEHPFAEFGVTHGKKAAYRAVLRDENFPGARVFLRGTAGDPVGFELPLGKGALIALPPTPQKDADRMAMAQTLSQCLERWHNRGDHGEQEAQGGDVDQQPETGAV
jgi:hypothetical protein